jgi:hypothetical protein
MQMTAEKCQDLAARLAEGSTMGEKVARFNSFTGGRAADAPGESALCYDFLETLLGSRVPASREIAAVMCLGLTAGLPSPAEPPPAKVARERSRQILGSIRSSRDPSYGGNILPMIRSYVQGNDEDRSLTFYGLISLLKSRTASEREAGRTACLGFLVFACGQNRGWP